jgi:hypothetical protein
MTISFSSWLSDAGDLAATPTANESMRAALAWRRINDKPSSVVFKTPAGATLSAQTIRVESDSSASAATSEAGMAPTRKIVLFGVRNHATVADTIVDEGYRFVSGGDEYRVVAIVNTLGEVQALAEASG